MPVEKKKEKKIELELILIQVKNGYKWFIIVYMVNKNEKQNFILFYFEKL